MTIEQRTKRAKIKKSFWSFPVCKAFDVQRNDLEDLANLIRVTAFKQTPILFELTLRQFIVVFSEMKERDCNNRRRNTTS